MSTRQSPQLVDNHGREIHLGEQLGKGGQGRVHAVNGDPTKAAKIYLEPTTQSHDAKLNAMVSMANDELFAWGAWPSNTLHLPSGKPVGFLMPRFDHHRTMYDLFNPKMRAQHFPGVDWRFMFAAATNMARAFVFAHQAGLVIGDVNDGNLLVAKDATCKFLDFDSCQFSYWGHQWLCDVGTKEYQPPEMGSNKTPRTPNYDNFGLAVLIFQLLFAGRHPFFGVYQLDGDAPDSVEAIKAFRYAYSEEPWRTEMLPPPNALPIEAIPAKIRNMFELAFSPAGVGGRPTASDWVTALRGIGPSLRQCTHNAAHYYHWDHCHWCDIEANSGVSLFSCAAPPPPPVAPPAPPVAASQWNWPPAPPPHPKPARAKRPRPVVQPPAPPAWQATPPQPSVTPFVPPIQQAAQSVSFQAGWLIGKAWGWTKGKASAYPAFATIVVLFGGIWLLSLIISAFSPPTSQVAAQPPAPTVPSRVAQAAPPPPALTYTPPPPVAPLPAPHEIASPPPPPAPDPAPLPRVVTPYTPPPPALTYAPPPPVAAPTQPPIQPDITLPALRPPATPQTVLPALRPPGTDPTTQFSISRVGPSFDCAKAEAPLLKIICADDDLSRSNLEMMQPLYVLRQLAASKVDLDTLVVDAHNATETMADHCGIDNFDTVPATVKACYNAAFKKQRADWMARLQGDGLEEASRNIEHHILLQAKLQSLGYIPATAKIDGVYGTDTRAAIVNWQTASSLPPTGLLSNSQVSVLLQSPPMVQTPETIQQTAAFAEGLRDRGVWELWFAGMTGKAHDGADYWSSHRSLPHATCSVMGIGTETKLGCMAAAKELAPFDARRKADPDYRRGWNSY